MSAPFISFRERLTMGGLLMRWRLDERWRLSIGRPKEIRLRIDHTRGIDSHFIAINVCFLLSLIEERRIFLTQEMGKVAVNRHFILDIELEKNDYLFRHVKAFDIYSKMGEYEAEGWEDSAKIGVYHREIANEIFHTLEPELLIPFSLDKCGFAQLCEICSTRTLSSEDQSLNYQERMQREENFETVYKQIVDDAYQRNFGRGHGREIVDRQPYYYFD